MEGDLPNQKATKMFYKFGVQHGYVESRLMMLYTLTLLPLWSEYSLISIVGVQMERWLVNGTNES